MCDERNALSSELLGFLCVVICWSFALFRSIWLKYFACALAKVNAMHVFVRMFAWLPNIFHFGIIRARELLLLLLCFFLPLFLCSSRHTHTHDQYIFTNAIFTNAYHIQSNTYIYECACNTDTYTSITSFQRTGNQVNGVVCVRCLSSHQCKHCHVIFELWPRKAMQ